MDNDLPEECYQAIQSLIRATPTLLVGSGFSCGYNLPGMGELGSHLIETMPNYLTNERIRKIWESSLESIKDNLEEGLNTISLGSDGRNEIIDSLRKETARLILDRTIKAEKLIQSQPSQCTLPLPRLLRKLFYGAPQNAESISVITTNYDTLVELFCDIASLPIDTGFSGYRYRKPRKENLFLTQYKLGYVIDGRKRIKTHQPSLTVRVYKPHGSITWNKTENGPVEVTNDASCIDKAIVIPGPSKYEDALTNTLFDSIRTEMNAVLSKTSSLLCLGFGFNDVHLQGVIKNRLRDGMPTLILTRSLTPNIKSLIHDHKHIIAIAKNGEGSECYFNGKQYYSPKSLWELDPFLIEFIE
ncbi:SIR2 family protein [Pantoea agglomerans]|uniref:SIR2 family protein n=1 Tax=Enterobacter agglomerans TaxID=549 RepID=UPI0009076AE0|nr:SIR2 family protein [Pantoea agglomerans]